MSITVDEKWESRHSMTGPNARIERVYVIDGTDDDLAAKQALADATPSMYDGLVRGSREVDRIGEYLWEGTVHYRRKESTAEPPQTGDSVFSFDTTGGTQHITQSLGNVARYAPSGETAPNYWGAIGVTEDSVEGVDITVPVYQFNETHYLPDSMITEAYKDVLFDLTGTVNDAVFRGLPAGSVLFLGARGTQRGIGEDWEIAFTFAGSPNVTGMTIGNITGIDKLGWEYAWIRYEDVEDEDAKMLVKRPTSVHIEKVYEFGDYSALGIGT